jgi:hypothetical protein
MTRGVRITAWILSSLAVLWTVGALAMTGLMMSGAGGACPMCGMMMGGGMMGQGGGATGTATGGGGMMGGAMTGGMMWMMPMMGLTWVVMLGLDAVFVYLVVSALRARRSAGLRPVA